MQKLGSLLFLNEIERKIEVDDLAFLTQPVFLWSWRYRRLNRMYR
jgi:hypothetical protein